METGDLDEAVNVDSALGDNKSVIHLDYGEDEKGLVALKMHLEVQA